MRMEYYITLNPLIWKRLNETFVWLLIDESYVLLARVQKLSFLTLEW